MEWSESVAGEVSADNEAEVDAATDGAYEDEAPEDAGLFRGDTGKLPYDARRVLVKLLLGPAIDARRHSRLWPSLLRYEQELRGAVSELFLELVLDADDGVAFLRQADTGDLDAPTLLRSLKLTLLDSVLVLYLRSCLTQAENRGERAVVEHGEIVEHLHLYERADSTDRAGFEGRINASVKRMKDHSILRVISGAESRYEVSPSLRLLFPPEQVSELTTVYEALREGRVDVAEDRDDDVMVEDDHADSPDDLGEEEVEA